MKKWFILLMILILFVLAACDVNKNPPKIPTTITFGPDTFELNEYVDKSYYRYKSPSGDILLLEVNSSLSHATVTYRNKMYSVNGSSEKYTIYYPDGTFIICGRLSCHGSADVINGDIGIDGFNFIFLIYDYYNDKPSSASERYYTVFSGLIVPFCIILAGILSIHYPENVERYPRIFWWWYKEPPQYSEGYIFFSKIVGSFSPLLGIILLIFHIINNM